MLVDVELGPKKNVELSLEPVWFKNNGLAGFRIKLPSPQNMNLGDPLEFVNNLTDNNVIPFRPRVIKNSLQNEMDNFFNFLKIAS